MKSSPAWSKLSSAQSSTATPCAGSTVPVVEVERKQRGHRRRGVMGDVVPADLPRVIGKPVGERLRFREEQQPHVLVGVAGEQHDVGGLDIFLAALEIGDAGDAAAPLV